VTAKTDLPGSQTDGSDNGKITEFDKTDKNKKLPYFGRRGVRTKSATVSSDGPLVNSYRLLTLTNCGFLL